MSPLSWIVASQAPVEVRPGDGASDPAGCKQPDQATRACRRWGQLPPSLNLQSDQGGANYLRHVTVGPNNADIAMSPLSGLNCIQQPWSAA